MPCKSSCQFSSACTLRHATPKVSALTLYMPYVGWRYITASLPGSQNARDQQLNALIRAAADQHLLWLHTLRTGRSSQ